MKLKLVLLFSMLLGASLARAMDDNVIQVKARIAQLEKERARLRKELWQINAKVLWYDIKLYPDFYAKRVVGVGLGLIGVGLLYRRCYPVQKANEDEDNDATINKDDQSDDANQVAEKSAEVLK